MKLRSMSPILLALLILTTQSACVQTNRTAQTTAVGAGLGGATGALLGQAIGKTTQSTLTGAAVGTGVGALAGYAYGQYLDRQEEELRNRFRYSRDVRVTRARENELKVGFDSNTMFAPNSATLQPAAKQNIRNTSTVLKRYPNSQVEVRGDDAAGSNRQLSERRTKALRQELVTNGIADHRINTSPNRESKPTAAANPANEHQLNRGVELLIREPNTQG